MKKTNFFLLVAAAACLVACGGQKGGGMNFGDNEFPIETVGTTSAEMQTTYPATIKGMQDVEIRPKISGFLTRVNVHEGQSVAAGQTLFVMVREQQLEGDLAIFTDLGCVSKNLGALTVDGVYTGSDQ